MERPKKGPVGDGAALGAACRPGGQLNQCNAAAAAAAEPVLLLLLLLLLLYGFAHVKSPNALPRRDGRCSSAAATATTTAAAAERSSAAPTTSKKSDGE